MKRKIVIGLFIVFTLTFGVYQYLYKEHRDITSEEAVSNVTVEELFKKFSRNIEEANNEYLDKTIIVNGIITNIDLSHNVITLDDKLSASFKEKLDSNLMIDQEIEIKGRLIGFDDLLEELKMDQCSLQK